jgi:hypothetical protein
VTLKTNAVDLSAGALNELDDGTSSGRLVAAIFEVIVVVEELDVGICDGGSCKGNWDV